MKTLLDRFAPVESKRGMFFQLGLTAATGLSLIAFKWTTYESSTSNLSAWDPGTEYIVDEVIPVVRQSAPKTARALPVYDVIKLIEDKREVKADPEPDPVFNPEKFFEYDPFGDDFPDEPDEIRIVTNKGPVDHWAVERMPYYNECSDFKNPEAESNCTAGAIVGHINSVLTYPAIARTAGVEGTVKLMFIIDENGKATDIEVIRKVHPSLDKEAMRALSLIPPMNPAKQNGHPVKVRYITDVAFRLKKN